jgi:hypothetical protein
MPVRTNLLEHFLFLQLNQAPGPILDLIGAVGFRALAAALRLGVFDALAEDGPQSAAALAGQLHLSERGTARLLDFLTPLGYLRRDGDRYANTPMTTRWLVKSAPASFAPGMLFWAASLEQLWDGLEESIRAGEPPISMYEWIETRPGVSQIFQEWMVSLAKVAAPEIMSKLPGLLPASARRALDVGGGHAMYSVELCRRFPNLTATVLDSPQALNTARQTVAAEGMAERILLQPGDILNGDSGTGFDVALLFNIVHGFEPQGNLALLRRVAAALNPGGVLVIVEQLAGPALGPGTQAGNTMFGLTYFHVLGGGIYTYDQIVGWLAATGFGPARRINLLRAPGSSLILAAKT